MTTIPAGISVYNQGHDRRTAGHMPVFERKSAEATAPAETAAPTEHSAFYNFFKGIFDIINPLQHIPVVSAIYRHVTGDEPGPVARFVGDALYGGPIGAAVAVADIALEKSTGKDMGETAFAMLDNKDDKDSSVQLAQNSRQIPAPAVIAWNGPAPSDTPAPTQVTVHASKTAELARTASLAAPQQNAPKGAALPAPSGQIAPVDIVNIAPASGETYFKTTETSDKKMIAAKMMDALDKYATMKSAGLAPASSTMSAAF